MFKIKCKFVLFWIRSSRNTNEKKVQKFPTNATKEEIEEILEIWVECFGVVKRSDYFVEYGYKTIKMPSRKELLQKWEKLYKRKNKIDEQVSILSAMLAATNN